ncbi:DUF6868 family protein [Oceanibacterium hippocampi]|uniref:DUF6868 domain-containing protein n=1 Tax=Oceanibacterium hippocampi TaxID=745714 RepID=A0A1Y5S3A9_9PROT|nr:hypothetical protein [Oceanibacterium hippocampi]SLN31654.1 hypothetical protein OCH7691_01133 [Oceanibacterium hippocampi]
MDIRQWLAFLKWCTILNGGLLAVSAVVAIVIPDWAVAMHSRLFGIPPEVVGGAFYGFVALLKILWLFFNLLPWLALRIVVRG